MRCVKQVLAVSTLSLQPSVFDHLVPRTIAELEEKVSRLMDERAHTHTHTHTHVQGPNSSLLQQSAHPPVTRLLSHGQHVDVS